MRYAVLFIVPQIYASPRDLCATTAIYTPGQIHVLVGSAAGLRFAIVGGPIPAETHVQVHASKNSGYRTFLDARGRVWAVWMVHPSSIERRRMERRSPVENAVFLIEQRVLGDRREQTGARQAVASEYTNGWLCFASGGEKRRLAPVPVNWMSANDSQVAEWCRIAKRVLKCGPTWDPGDEEEVPRSRPKRAGPDRDRRT